MPKVRGFEVLPAEHRAWLLGQWRRSGYGDNARIAAELNARLAGDDLAGDYDPSTVYRWARDHKASANKIRYAAELRAATIAALPEPDPALSARIGEYLDHRIVETFEELDTLDDLAPLDRAQALEGLMRATIARRKVELDQDRQALARQRFEAEQQVRQEERAKAAGAAESAARTQGVSAEGIAALRAAILGAL